MLCSKTPYKNKQEASLAAAGAVVRNKGAPKVLWVYRCRFCFKWHLTSQHQTPNKKATKIELL